MRKSRFPFKNPLRSNSSKSDSDISDVSSYNKEIIADSNADKDKTEHGSVPFDDGSTVDTLVDKTAAQSANVPSVPIQTVSTQTVSKQVVPEQSVDAASPQDATSNVGTQIPNTPIAPVASQKDSHSTGSVYRSPNVAQQGGPTQDPPQQSTPANDLSDQSTVVSEARDLVEQDLIKKEIPRVSSVAPELRVPARRADERSVDQNVSSSLSKVETVKQSAKVTGTENQPENVQTRTKTSSEK